eukprot:744765-Hanusia_phi.AAC.2
MMRHGRAAGPGTDLGTPGDVTRRRETPTGPGLSSDSGNPRDHCALCGNGAGSVRRPPPDAA